MNASGRRITARALKFTDKTTVRDVVSGLIAARAAVELTADKAKAKVASVKRRSAKKAAASKFDTKNPTKAASKKAAAKKALKAAPKKPVAKKTVKATAKKAPAKKAIARVPGKKAPVGHQTTYTNLSNPSKHEFEFEIATEGNRERKYRC